MRMLVPVFLGALLLGGTDGETLKLELLPKPEKGQEEKIEIDAAYSRATGKSVTTKHVTGSLKRSIKALDEDGLPAKEILSLEKATFEDGVEGGDDGQNFSSSSELDQTWTRTVKRDGKARRARVGELPDEYYQELGCVLQDDPDAVVRAILPEGKVAKSDEWEVDPAKLLVLFGPSKAKIAEKSKATATFASFKKDEALVTVEATLRFTTPDDPEVERRLGVQIEVRGAIDGSAPPRKQRVVLSQKTREGKKDAKETVTISLKREWAEKEEEDGDGEKEKAKEKEKERDKRQEKKSK